MCSPNPPVFLPEALQLLLPRVLAAGELEGELHGVGEEVVEVLHAPLHDVPVGAVGDAAGKIVRVTQTNSLGTGLYKCFSHFWCHMNV